MDNLPAPTKGKIDRSAESQWFQKLLVNNRKKAISHILNLQVDALNASDYSRH